MKINIWQFRLTNIKVSIIMFYSFLYFFMIINCGFCSSLTSAGFELEKGKYIKEYVFDKDDATFRVIDKIIEAIYKSKREDDKVLNESIKSFNDYLIKRRLELLPIIEKINQFDENEDFTIDIEKEQRDKRIYYAGLQFEFTAFLVSYVKNKYIWSEDKIDIQTFFDKMLKIHKEVYEIRNIINKTVESIDKYPASFDPDKLLRRIDPFIPASVDRDIIHSYLIIGILEKDILDFLDIKKDMYITSKAKIKSGVVWRDIVYQFYQKDNNDIFFSLNFKKKGDGAQAGGILEYTKQNGENNRIFFVKTHQEGSVISRTSDFFRSPQSSRGSGPVNLKEMFVYKLLENLEVGPETFFFINPISNNGLLIATKDVVESKNDHNIKFVTAFSALGRRIGSPKIIKEDLSNLEKETIEKLKLEFLKMDLLARVLNINDLNEGNYGIIVNNDDSIDVNKLSIKIVDFRAPNIQLAGYDISKDIFIRNFSTANGGIYDVRSKKVPFAKTVLGVYKSDAEDTLEQLKLKFHRAKFVYDNLLRRIKQNEMVDKSVDSVNNFLKEKNFFAKDYNFRMLGIENLDENDEQYNDFIIYINAIKRNIDSFGKFIDEFLN